MSLLMLTAKWCPSAAAQRNKKGRVVAFFMLKRFILGVAAAAILAAAAFSKSRKTLKGQSPTGLQWEVRRPGAALGSKRPDGWRVYVATPTSGGVPIRQSGGRFDTFESAVAYARAIP